MTGRPGVHTGHELANSAMTWLSCRVTEKEIYERIDALVAEEHELRTKRTAGDVGGPEEHERLSQLEATLDQCWDLLRQRRARKDAGQNPNDAQSASVSQVEGYLQ